MNLNAPRQNLFFIIAALLLPVIYGVCFIRNFSLPLTGHGDIDEWEFIGYYLAKNISFDFLPQLQLRQNQTFYPYGITQTFSDWSLESNYWFAFFYKNWGHGGWLNYYYVLSLIIAFLGSYLLLKKEFGKGKAFFVGFVVTFFNFYALNKYPHHFNHSTIHWTILSILADFILTKRIILKEKISLKWVFLKAFLLIATLGMNLSYMCGFALTSFVLSLLVVAVIFVRRYFKGENQLSGYLRHWGSEIKKSPALYALLVLPSLILLYLYLPIVWQIYRETQVFKSDSGHTAHLWSHPLRMLFPYFPFFNAGGNPLISLLKDMPEGIGSGSPGWFCLGVGLAGFYFNRKKYWLAFLPLIILLVISTFYHPVRVPTLRIFPWGAFNRVPSRFTSILPVIFCCFVLPLDFGRLKSYKILAGFLIAIGLIEGFMVYRVLWNRNPFIIDSNFYNYMATVEKQKGEAVLDFPFCIVDGAGAGLEENLCPIFQKTCNVYALSRFHHKKVIGGYYSHIPVDALNGFVKTGVGNLLTPETEDWRLASRIVNDFSDEQLQYFIKYFQYHDFAGINLCVDLIPAKLYQQIVDAVGQPIQTTIFPGAGKVVFIPKPDQWKAFVNRKNALGIKYPCGCP